MDTIISNMIPTDTDMDCKTQYEFIAQPLRFHTSCAFDKSVDRENGVTEEKEIPGTYINVHRDDDDLIAEEEINFDLTEEIVESELCSEGILIDKISYTDTPQTADPLTFCSILDHVPDGGDYVDGSVQLYLECSDDNENSHEYLSKFYPSRSVAEATSQIKMDTQFKISFPSVPERALKCSLCRLLFLSKDFLREHTIIKHSEQFHFCKLCPYFTKSKKFFKMHINTRHKQCISVQEQSGFQAGCLSAAKCKSKVISEEIGDTVTVKEMLDKGNLEKTGDTVTVKEMLDKVNLEKTGDKVTVKEMMDKIGDTVTVKEMLDKVNLEKTGDKVTVKEILDKIGDTVTVKEMLDKIGDTVTVKEMLDKIGDTVTLKEMLDKVNLEETGDTVTLKETRDKFITHDLNTDINISDQQICNPVISKTEKKKYFRKVEQTVKCEECEFKTKSNRLLNYHRQTMHDKNRHIFKCSACEYACWQRRSFLSHLKRHEGIYDFLCQTCDKKFVSKHLLTKHARKHKDESVEKKANMYTIGNDAKHAAENTAEKTVSVRNNSTQTNLATTTLISDYRSDNERKFNTLKQNRKNFKCTFDTCPKVFRDAFNLRKHLAVHSKSESVKCDYCSYTCVKMRTLNNHIRMKHA